LSFESSALIVTFSSSHTALRSERSLKGRGLAVDLIPVPREISSACGFCLLVPLGVEGMREMVESATAAERESIWLVLERPEDGGARRKEKRYERIA
jgi:hypothetical protein